MAPSLFDVFQLVAHKVLAKVDLPGRSNQHELNGTAELRGFFAGDETVSGEIQWFYFADGRDVLSAEGSFTFYDARKASAFRTGRSEWRLYYEGSFLRCAEAGDLLVLARGKKGELFALVFQKGSAWFLAGQALFGIKDLAEKFSLLPPAALQAQQLELMRQTILEELGIAVEVPSPEADEELVKAKFGLVFPTSKEMSAFAQTQTSVDLGDPDSALQAWLERERQLFRSLEAGIIKEALRRGFESVDDFISYSISIVNRRKARMGLALQNHLHHLFKTLRIRFAPQMRTEGNNRPDFIFPGEAEYRNPAYPSENLVMLAVKSTSKDRWRQILVEADRIRRKHLCTLEPGISAAQTSEMARKRVALVIPSALHATYSEAQRRTIMSVGDFVEFVRDKESASRN